MSNTSDAVSYEHFEIIEYLNLSEDTAEELAGELSGHSLVEDRSYDGFMLVKHHEGDSDE